MQNPFHNPIIFSLGFIVVMFLDMAFTFMGVYNLGWELEGNKFLMKAIINKDVTYPFLYLFWGIAMIGITNFYWFRVPRFYHYVYWGLLGFISYISWFSWLIYIIEK